jgi:hypothetical protein
MIMTSIDCLGLCQLLVGYKLIILLLNYGPWNIKVTLIHQNRKPPLGGFAYTIKWFHLCHFCFQNLGVLDEYRWIWRFVRRVKGWGWGSDREESWRKWSRQQISMNSFQGFTCPLCEGLCLTLFVFMPCPHQITQFVNPCTFHVLVFWVLTQCRFVGRQCLYC